MLQETQNIKSSRELKGKGGKSLSQLTQALMSLQNLQLLPQKSFFVFAKALLGCSCDKILNPSPLRSFPSSVHSSLNLHYLLGKNTAQSRSSAIWIGRCTLFKVLPVLTSFSFHQHAQGGLLRAFKKKIVIGCGSSIATDFLKRKFPPLLRGTKQQLKVLTAVKFSKTFSGCSQTDPIGALQQWPEKHSPGWSAHEGANALPPSALRPEAATQPPPGALLG